MSDLGGGPYNGYIPKQIVTTKRDSENSTTRSILRKSWDGYGAKGLYNTTHNRVITPFRAVMHLGDPLARQYYSCGGPAQYSGSKPGYRNYNFVQQCDATGVPAGSGNSRYVSDSSLYTRFRKEQAINQTYNDSTYSGDLDRMKRQQYLYLKALRRK